MYGGDDTLSGFVTGYVADRLAALGVTLNQVRVTDTADAVNKVLGEKQAGRSSGGSVDLIWINGENFSTGVQADLWSCGWSTRAAELPLRRLHPPRSQQRLRHTGGGLRGAVAGGRLCSGLRQRPAVRVRRRVRLVTAELGHGTPGRFTYPAVPDFTGSMAVRTILYDTIGGPDSLTDPFDEDAYTARRRPAVASAERDREQPVARRQHLPTLADRRGEALQRRRDRRLLHLWPGRGGRPGEGRVYPDSTREAVLDGGNIGNVSFLATPANAEHSAAALVLANILLDPK
ncbi:MAG: ABC transporter substrate-binding protein, partial [Nocardioidaceae bacterium]